MILLLLCYWLMKWYEKHKRTEITLHIISAITLDESHSTAHFSWLLRLQTTNYKDILLKTETKYKQKKRQGRKMKTDMSRYNLIGSHVLRVLAEFWTSRTTAVKEQNAHFQQCLPGI